MALTERDREELLNLGQNLPRVWQASSTTAEDRKHILRCVIKEVVVDRTRTQGHVCFQVNWQTGLVTHHQYERSVNRYCEHPRREQLEQRVRALREARKYDSEMATILNAEGFRTSRGKLFTSDTVSLLRMRIGVPPVPPTPILPLRWEDGTYSVEGVAHELGVLRSAVYRWLYAGRLEGHRDGKRGEWKIALDAEQIAKLREHARRSKCRIIERPEPRDHPIAESQ